jgi:hypothetical protein
MREELVRKKDKEANLKSLEQRKKTYMRIKKMIHE